MNKFIPAAASILLSLLTAGSVAHGQGNLEAAPPCIKTCAGKTLFEPHSRLYGPRIKIGTIEHQKNFLVWDFTNVAFSNALWLENSWSPWDGIDAAYNPHPGLKGSWMEGLAGGEVLPRHGVLNRWNREKLSVSLWWPSFGPKHRYGTDALTLGEREKVEAISDLVRTQVNAIAPGLRDATGIDISYVDPDAPSESTADFARIRILPVTRTGLVNRFKSAWKNPLMHHIEEWGGGFLHNWQARIGTAVPFTAASRAQVDGFILSGEGNAIGLAACKVLVTNGEEMLRALVSECLVRALGLPEMSRRKNDQSLLGNWNMEQEAVSLLPLFEGREALAASQGNPVSVGSPPRPPGHGPEAFETTFYTAPLHVTEKIPAGLSEYDAAMLSALYCEAIHPGMDRYQAIKALSLKPECFLR